MAPAPTSVFVIGATGATGVHFVKLALEKGLKVKALVRNVSKLAAGEEMCYNRLLFTCMLSTVHGHHDQSPSLQCQAEGICMLDAVDLLLFAS